MRWKMGSCSRCGEAEAFGAGWEGQHTMPPACPACRSPCFTLQLAHEIGTDVALMHLHGIAQKVKFKGLQEKAHEPIDPIAEARGLSADAGRARCSARFAMSCRGRSPVGSQGRSAAAMSSSSDGARMGAASASARLQLAIRVRGVARTSCDAGAPSAWIEAGVVPAGW